MKTVELSAIYAQSGFEYQKCVFVYYVLQMSHLERVCYEGADDVELQKDYIPLCKINASINNRKLIQVKSGKVNNDTFNKILLNWLNSFDNNAEYIFFTENDIEFEYNNAEFINKLVNKIKNSSNKSNAIITKVKEKYDNKEEILIENLTWLVQNCKKEVMSKENIIQEIQETFNKFYTEEGTPLIIVEEQVEELLKEFRNNIAKAILNKSSYEIEFKNLLSIIREIKNKINNETYCVDFDEFKNDNIEKVNEMFNKCGESVQQLKLVTDKTDKIIVELVNQLFYEDFRAHFISINKEKKIKDLEIVANDNYKEVLFELEDTQNENNPKEVFIKTTNKDLKSPLFMEQEGINKFYKKGCYIHLTDTGIDEEVKIKWGDLDVR